jgi:hypothetical protein
VRRAEVGWRWTWLEYQIAELDRQIAVYDNRYQVCVDGRFVEEFGDPANQALFRALVELLHWLGGSGSRRFGMGDR